MIVTNEVYREYVVEDLKKYEGLIHPAKASLALRAIPMKIDPKRLHPNPNDEFSMEDYGPNWNIIGDYEKSIRFHIRRYEDIFDDPIIVTKLDKSGYMILNGHHRWMACLNLRVPKVPVRVVNATQEEDVYKVINKSKRNKCITIDFDEVLFADALQDEAPEIPFPQKLIYKKNIRDNASLLIREFQRMGYDVWVYTGSYLSEQYIQGLFMTNHCRVDGIVNGLNGKKNPTKLRDIFRQKYHTILHADNESLTLVNPKTKKYEMIDIESTSEEWASAVVASARSFDLTTLDE